MLHIGAYLCERRAAERCQVHARVYCNVLYL